MRGRSFASPFYQQSPEFNEEVLHEGEELHPEVREALQEVQRLLHYPAQGSSSGGTRRLMKSRLCDRFQLESAGKYTSPHMQV
jgi:hypothetical protein